MTHWMFSKRYDRDLFTYETEGENAVGGTGVTFTIGADGKATTVSEIFCEPFYEEVVDFFASPQGGKLCLLSAPARTNKE